MELRFKYLGSLYFARKEKQSLEVFLTLTSQHKQAVRTISVENLSSANGVKLIIEKHDKLYLEDERSLV